MITDRQIRHVLDVKLLGVHSPAIPDDPNTKLDPLKWIYLCYAFITTALVVLDCVLWNNQRRSREHCLLATHCRIARSRCASPSVCHPLFQIVVNPNIVTQAAQYIHDNGHWAGSSSQVSRCSVHPTTPAEVATIVCILQAETTLFE